MSKKINTAVVSVWNKTSRATDVMEYNLYTAKYMQKLIYTFYEWNRRKVRGRRRLCGSTEYIC